MNRKEFWGSLAMYPVIAVLCGLAPGSHSRGIYAGEAKPGTGLTASMLNFDTLARIGSERGDRAEIERINAGTYALPVGQPTIISRDLPVGDPWLTMRLNLRGDLRDPGAPATGTVRPDSPLTLFDIALTTDLDRDVVEPSVSAKALYRFNQFLYGTAGAITAAVLPNTNTTSFRAVVDIPFIDPRMKIPMDTVLDTRRYNAVTLTITTGTILSLLNAPAVTTVLENCNVDIEIVRVSPRVPMPPTVAKALPFFKRHAPIVPPGDTFINLDKVPTLAVKRVLAFTSNAAAGTNEPLVGIPFTGIGVDTIIGNMRISSNFRDHFGSALGGVSFRTLQAGNKVDYAIEAWPAGWYVADFVLEGNLGNALATGDKSMLQALFTYQGAGANIQQLSLLVNGMQKLRGGEGT